MHVEDLPGVSQSLTVTTKALQDEFSISKITHNGMCVSGRPRIFMMLQASTLCIGRPTPSDAYLLSSSRLESSLKLLLTGPVFRVTKPTSMPNHFSRHQPFGFDEARLATVLLS